MDDGVIELVGCIAGKGLAIVPPLPLELEGETIPLFPGINVNKPGLVVTGIMGLPAQAALDTDHGRET